MSVTLFPARPAVIHILQVSSLAHVVHVKVVQNVMEVTKMTGTDSPHIKGLEDEINHIESWNKNLKGQIRRTNDVIERCYETIKESTAENQNTEQKIKNGEKEKRHLQKNLKKLRGKMLE